MARLRRAVPLALLLAGCGNVSLLDNNLPPVPTITAFTAVPSSLPDGGSSILSWTVVNQDVLILQPGAANVSGFTSANETPTVTTTYTLTASNSLGEVSSSVIVSVGP